MGFIVHIYNCTFSEIFTNEFAEHINFECDCSDEVLDMVQVFSRKGFTVIVEDESRKKGD